MISAGGYHLNGSAATSALYPASVSARLRPSTCDSAPPVVKGTCVVQMSTLRTDIGPKSRSRLQSLWRSERCQLTMKAQAARSCARETLKDARAWRGNNKHGWTGWPG